MVVSRPPWDVPCILVPPRSTPPKCSAGISLGSFGAWARRRAPDRCRHTALTHHPGARRVLLTRALHHLPVFDHQLAHGLEHLATHLHCPWRVHLAAHHVHHPAAHHAPHHGAHTALHPPAVRCRRRGGRLLYVPHDGGHDGRRD